jgi:hypothetical protein
VGRTFTAFARTEYGHAQFSARRKRPLTAGDFVTASARFWPMLPVRDQEQRETAIDPFETLATGCFGGPC